MTERPRPLADAWRPIVGKSDADVARLIGDDRIDVLVDLTMYMSGCRPLLVAHKPSPVQSYWLAHPGSTATRRSTISLPTCISIRLAWPRADYLALYHEIDLALDTFPYGGHTTSLDAYWMGVPVVTLVGQTVVGRAGLSQLQNLGLPELIAYTAEQFVATAANLVADLPRLGEATRNTASAARNLTTHGRPALRPEP